MLDIRYCCVLNRKNRAGEVKDPIDGGDICFVMSDNKEPLNLVICEQRSAGAESCRYLGKSSPKSGNGICKASEAE